MRLTVCNLKGGTGKTTSSIFLAAGLSRFGRTSLIDADRQESASTWVEMAPEVPFAISALASPTLHRRIEQNAHGFDQVIIDTPPNVEAVVASAIRAADTVLIPMSPTLVDSARLRPTMDLLASIAEEFEHEPEVFVLLTRVRAGTTSSKEIRQILTEDFGLSLLAAQIPLREMYANAYGMIPTDLGAYEDVVSELRAAKVAG